MKNIKAFGTFLLFGVLIHINFFGPSYDSFIKTDTVLSNNTRSQTNMTLTMTKVRKRIIKPNVIEKEYPSRKMLLYQGMHKLRDYDVNILFGSQNVFF